MQPRTMEYSFGDLVDLDKIQGLAESFYRLTGIPPSITDVEGNVLVKVGWQRICTEFHRKHPQTLERCVQSDTELAKQLNGKTGYASYKCLNGLVDMAAPIIIGERHVANLFAGQFFLDPPDREFFRKQAATFGFDETEYLQALDRVPVLPREKLELGMNFLTALASLLGEMGLNQKELSELNLHLEAKVRERTLRLEHEMEERKKAEAEKIRAGKLQGVLEMAGAAAHEFSQPLQTLSFDVDFLQGQLGDNDKEVGEALQSMRDNVTALSRLINKVQNITTYEVAEYSDDLQIIDLDKASQN